MKRDYMTAEIARAFLSYDKETGELTWREREFLSPIKKHSSKRWNETYAGKRACRSGPKGYLIVSLCDKAWLAHRIAWLIVTGEWPAYQVDHINGDKSDNRWSNLRAANNSQNHANIGLLSSNTSGLKGVVRTRRKWGAQIQVSKKNLWLGNFDCPAAASFAYQIAADKAFGEFARWEAA
jgi:hypothetical protein